MEYTQIKNTPFTLVQDEENKICFAAVAQYRVTALEELNEENKKKIMKSLEKPNWDNIIPVIEVLVNRVLTNKKQNHGRNTKNN